MNLRDIFLENSQFATYRDPELWLRLEPLLAEEMLRASAAITGTSLPDYQTYREKMGYLRALEWVAKQAIHLTRVTQPDDTELHEDC